MQLKVLVLGLLANAVDALVCNAHSISVHDNKLEQVTAQIRIRCNFAIRRADFRAFARYGTTEVPGSSVYKALPDAGTAPIDRDAFIGFTFPPNIVNSYNDLNFCVSYQAYDANDALAPLAGGCRTSQNAFVANGGKLSCEGCRKQLCLHPLKTDGRLY
ncbi:MAG: hypothetical protein M1816_001482 [Peltula sp. TS41687]|nr:MAG: hypothetical protein M1816_001482 [Peltula sp. TS41687]